MNKISQEDATRLLKIHTNKITADKLLYESILLEAPPGIDFCNIKHILFHIANRLTQIPRCKNSYCNSLVKWNKQNQKYTETCGYKCSNKLVSDSTIKARKITNQKKYGGNAPACNSVVRAKMKKTNIAKYGDNYVKKHAKLSKQAIMNRYGVCNISQQHITQNTRTRLNDVEYLYLEHVIKHQPLQSIAHKLGVSDTTISRYLTLHNIEIKRFYTSAGEIEIQEFLREIDIDFIPNTKSIITPLELDIYIPAHNLAIEYNGLYWHSEKCNKLSNFHLNKTELCEEKGIRLIHIFEDEWRDQKQQCKDTLRHLFGKSIRGAYARNTTIHEISWREAKSFLKKYHLLGAGTCGNYRIGAFDAENNLIGVMVFGKINNESGDNSAIELKRFVTDKKNNPGLGSKMFKHAITNNQYESVIAFVDRRWFTGLVKRFIGFEMISITPPSVWWTNGKYRYHRRFKTKQQLICDGHDAKLSKRAILKTLGYYRIWDCGKIKLKWTK